MNDKQIIEVEYDKDLVKKNKILDEMEKSDIQTTTNEDTLEEMLGEEGMVNEY